MVRAQLTERESAQGSHPNHPTERAGSGCVGAVRATLIQAIFWSVELFLLDYYGMENEIPDVYVN